MEEQTLRVIDSNELTESGDEDQDINIYETAKLSLQFIVLWFSANLVTNASLSYTSVASQTILSSTSSFFTLIIGYLVSIEKINQNKILGILLSFAGVLIVTKADATEDNPNTDNSALHDLAKIQDYHTSLQKRKEFKHTFVFWICWNLLFSILMAHVGDVELFWS